MKSLLIFMFFVVFGLSGCGGGSSSSNAGAQGGTAPPSVGNISILVGDAPLDGIDQVLINIREIRLLGTDGQVVITDEPVGTIDLLSLRNVTELIAAAEVPAGEYNKIRLFVDSLQIVETDNDTPVDVQLPANGKIDLNPQGGFELSPGEDLVVQIDFDLDRSVKVVTTGNSQYRFRPVVFIDVLDQTDNLRLVKLFGTLDEDAEGEESDFDLCTELDQLACVDLMLDEMPTILLADGNSAVASDLLLPDSATVFGHFFIGAQGGEFFRAKIIVLGAEDSITSIDGDVTSTVVADAFDLTSDANLVSVIVAGAVILDEIGSPLGEDISIGQQAEAWAQTVLLDAADAGDFPSFLVQVSEQAIEETTVQGNLIDLVDNTLTISNDDGQFCVTVSSDTEVQLISNYADDAESDVISLTALGDLISAGVEVEAFGEQVGDCLDAVLILAEID